MKRGLFAFILSCKEFVNNDDADSLVIEPRCIYNGCYHRAARPVS